MFIIIYYFIIPENGTVVIKCLKSFLGTDNLWRHVPTYTVIIGIWMLLNSYLNVIGNICTITISPLILLQYGKKICIHRFFFFSVGNKLPYYSDTQHMHLQTCAESPAWDTQKSSDVTLYDWAANFSLTLELKLKTCCFDYR